MYSSLTLNQDTYILTGLLWMPSVIQYRTISLPSTVEDVQPPHPTRQSHALMLTFRAKYVRLSFRQWSVASLEI